MFFLRNMSQQNESFGMMNQRAKFDYRFCFIHADKRVNLKYDVKQNDRFHHEILKKKNELHD